MDSDLKQLHAVVSSMYAGAPLLPAEQPALDDLFLLVAQYRALQRRRVTESVVLHAKLGCERRCFARKTEFFQTGFAAKPVLRLGTA